MDVREKLVELLNEVQETGVNEIPAGFGYTSEYVENEKVASHLIANGVTVQSERMVDAVPVVRCKDCKWLYSEMGNYCCRSHRGLVRICENSFCSYGERKDGDGNG